MASYTIDTTGAMGRGLGGGVFAATSKTHMLKGLEVLRAEAMKRGVSESAAKAGIVACEATRDEIRGMQTWDGEYVGI